MEFHVVPFRDAPLSELYDFDIAPDGRLIVLEGLEQVLLIKDSMSAPMWYKLGRRGKGPGEFEGAAAVDVDAAGTLWVVDVTLRRIQGIDRRGRPLASFRRAATGLLVPWPGRVTDDGVLVDFELERSRTALEGFYRSFVTPVFTTTNSGRSWKGATLSLESSLMPIRSGSVRTFVRVPFKGVAKLAVGPTGALWVLAEDGRYLHRIGRAGDTLVSLRMPHEPVPVGRREKDSVSAAWRRARIPLPPRVIPGFKSAVDRLVVSSSGCVLLFLATDRPGLSRRVDILPAPWASTLLRYELSRPVHTTPAPELEGGRLVAVVRDSLDVPSLVVAELDVECGR